MKQITWTTQTFLQHETIHFKMKMFGILSGFEGEIVYKRDRPTKNVFFNYEAAMLPESAMIVETFNRDRPATKRLTALFKPELNYSVITYNTLWKDLLKYVKKGGVVKIDQELENIRVTKYLKGKLDKIVVKFHVNNGYQFSGLFKVVNNIFCNQLRLYNRKICGFDTLKMANDVFFDLEQVDIIFGSDLCNFLTNPPNPHVLPCNRVNIRWGRMGYLVSGGPFYLSEIRTRSEHTYLLTAEEVKRDKLWRCYNSRSIPAIQVNICQANRKAQSEANMHFNMKKPLKRRAWYSDDMKEWLNHRD